MQYNNCMLVKLVQECDMSNAKNIYQANGYADREEYLACLAEEYDVSLTEVVQPIAYLLGPGEDFDGLVSTVRDYVNY